MHKVVYTRTLDDADEMIVKSIDCESKEQAITTFNNYIQAFIADIMKNEFIKFKMSMHNHKALVKIEGTTYCIAIVKE